MLRKRPEKKKERERERESERHRGREGGRAGGGQRETRANCCTRGEGTVVIKFESGVLYTQRERETERARASNGPFP